MIQLVDCPGCACLIDADARACPFCGATQRRVPSTGMLALGFVLGLATTSCGEKESGTQSTTPLTSSTADSETDPTTTTGTTDAPTSTTTSTTSSTSTGEDTTTDTFSGPGSAYALPPERETGTDPTAGDTDTDTGEVAP